MNEDRNINTIPVGCRFTGRSHLKKNMPCQDAFSVGETSDGRLVVAIADGVSSSPKSEKASEIAAAAAVEFWQDFHTAFPDEKAWKAALYTCMNYALRKTDELREDDEAFSFETTLMVSIISPGNEMHYAYAGDGGIYLLSDEGEVSLLEEPVRDEDGCVYTLSEGPDHWHSGTSVLSEISAVLMVTDGISDVIREAGTDYSLAKMFVQKADSDTEYAEICKQVLSDPCFRNMDDDVCVVMCKTDQHQSSSGKESEAPAAEPEAETDPEEAGIEAAQNAERAETQTVLPCHEKKTGNDKKGENLNNRTVSIFRKLFEKNK